MKKKSKALKGLATIEACFILPMTMILILGLLMYAVFVRDLSCIRDDMMLLLMGEHEAETETLQPDPLDAYRQSDHVRLAYLTCDAMEHHRTGAEMSLTAETAYPMAVYYKFFSGGGEEKGTVTAERRGYEPETVLRQKAAVGALIEPEAGGAGTDDTDDGGT